MPVMDEFREEREAIKQGTPKQKYQYFKDYYRTPLIIFLLAALFVGILVYHFVTRKDSAFYAVLLNCSPYQDNEWLQEAYADYAGIDLAEYDITFDTGVYYTCNSVDEDSYVTLQKLETYTGAGQLDVMLGAGEEFAYFANSILFSDLREILSEEQLQKYEPYFYYVDTSLLDIPATETLDFGGLPDPKKPEEMKNPVPVAIYVESSEKLNQAYYFKNAEDGIAIGIYANTSHPENALAFIDYILSDSQ